MPTNDNTMEIGHSTIIYNSALFITIHVAKSLVSSVSSAHSQRSFSLPNSLLIRRHNQYNDNVTQSSRQPTHFVAWSIIIYGDSVPKFSAQSTVFSWRQSWCLEATCKHRRHVRDDLTSSTCWFLWRSNLYYHRATFLQLNTITFLLPFPNPFIPSEPSGSRRNDSNSKSEFLFEDILPIIRCNSLQKVLDWPFCNLWQRAEPPNSKSDDAIPKRRRVVSGWNRNKTRFGCLWSGDWKFLWRQRVLLLPRQRSSSSRKFALISLGTHI